MIILQAEQGCQCVYNTSLSGLFPDTLDSCQGRCGYGTDSNYSCQCNPACERYNDCCSDYAALCKGTCGESYNSQNECHCNSLCPQYNNCCNDYTELCYSKTKISTHGQSFFFFSICPAGVIVGLVHIMNGD
uniref:SMB domain-containing protein n=1 Tax=Maylandia zebra TaxID=106582 RepID=A0A3P9BLV6_9CICH